MTAHKGIQVMKETMKVLQEKIAMLEIAKDLPSTKKALSEDEDSVTVREAACPSATNTIFKLAKELMLGFSGYQ